MLLLNSIILTTGLWRAALMTPGGELPFHIQIDKIETSYTLTVINGDERMLLDDVTIKNDSLIVRFPIYESELRLKAVTADELHGSFINLTRATHSSIPLVAYSGGAPRFYNRSKTPVKNVAGKWSVMFSPGTKDSSYAIGVFNQDGSIVKGTFLTQSGDYRYLEGVMENDSLFLSAFDGVFVYLFKAKVRPNTIDGMFYSGTHRQVAWSGSRDENARLPDPTAITSYKNKDLPFQLAFPNVDSVLVSLADSAFKNKVIVLQIMGSWCPNCLDESNFLEPYYRKNKGRGMEIIGLSFEKTDDFRRASDNVKRFRNRLNITYPLLVAANRDKIKTVLPGLENFVGFPTTIFLDKNHKIRKIHAGFSGPATGVEFEKYKDEFSLLMEKLLTE